MPLFFKRYIHLVALFVIKGICVYALPLSDSATEQYGSGKSIVLSLYQRHISPVKGGNTCPMYPSCSQYAKYAFSKFDPFSAFVASSDRFVRCGRDVADYPLVATGDGLKRYDSPVNDRLPEIIPSESSAPVRTATGDSGCASFASRLLRDRKYPPASLEFERIAYSTTDSACRREAFEGILACSYRSDNMTVFADNFYRVIDSLHDDTAVVSRCGILLAKRYFGAEAYGDMYGALRYYVRSVQLSAQRQFLLSLCHLMMHRPAAALLAADSIPRDSRLAALSDTLRLEINRFYKGEPSPPVAGLLSTVLPGAGYLYCGEGATAAASLLINGLFIWTTYDFAKSKHYAAAATSLLLCSGFYFGNITGSIKAAKCNAIKKRKKWCAALIDELRYEW